MEPPYLQKYINRMSTNLPSECVPNAGTKPIPNCSSCLTSLNCPNTHPTLTSAPCSKLCMDYLISLLVFLIPWQNSNTDRLLLFHQPFACTNYFYKLVCSSYTFYIEHTTSLLTCLIVTYHILDHMYGCILHITLPCCLA